LDQQARYFTTDQQDVYERISNRQYFKATAFLNMTKAKRNSATEKLADDIVSMIDRLRQLPTTSKSSPIIRGSARFGQRQREFSATAEDYAAVDFVRTSAVRIEPPENERERGVYAQVDFVERLFVRGTKALIEFGVMSWTPKMRQVAKVEPCP
jgi:hypothetical protein